MILKNFYTVVSKEEVSPEGSFVFEILINPEHEIFKGHFPGNPIMPGVCMMQITKDLVEGITETKLFMKKCSNVKFMAIINPEKNKKLQLKIRVSKDSEEDYKVTNVTQFEDTVALKINALYTLKK
ncbi:MAG: 3-hydroxyacyl-ACP dehydratase [Flavobacteriaceae bacterium]|nr:3-hydroxyacyl-ACP dehydratase [Flavobacteriaceae bacterium]